MTPTDTASSPSSGRGAALVLASAVLVAGVIAWQTAAIATLRDEIGAMRSDVDRLRSAAADANEAVRLLRIERGSRGLGADALIEQIEHIGPQLQSSGPTAPELAGLKSRMDDVLAAAGALSRDAFDRFTGALEASDHDEVRKWLIRAAVRTDETRGRKLLVDVLRGVRHSPSDRLRLLAADDLMEIDREVCGEVLKGILEIESAQGITRQPPPELRRDYEEMLKGERTPRFYNFIARFHATEHPDRENVLLMLLGRPEHDLLTYKECVHFLGELGSREAVPKIQELYGHRFGAQAEPFFQIECLNALHKILGSDACPFFKAALEQEALENVHRKLRELIKSTCQ